jgi:2-hydroxy-6-oxo-6-(2'-aminophenyl)hexa-2,4-dienoate hydrolase
MSHGDTASSSQWTSRYVDADGVRTHYLEAGDPAAPSVVLVHGGGAGADSTGNWRLTIPALAVDHHVVAVDMLGFGRTAKPEDIEYSQPARNRHLAAFLEALGLRRVPIVGNSMGGATALGVAMHEPELVDRLVLMGSAGLNAQITESLKPIVFYDYTLEGMHRLIEALTGSRFKVSEELVRLRYELSIEPETRRAYTATMEWIRRQGGLFYAEETIARVATPTLVVNGKNDFVVPLANAYRFLELLPNSWGYVIPHCGHWAMLEAPAEFVAATRNFLQAKVHA